MKLTEASISGDITVSFSMNGTTLRYSACHCSIAGDDFSGRRKSRDLRGVEQLYGKHALGVVDHAVELGGGVRAHRYMVFLALRRGYRVTAVGPAEPFRLVDNRRGTVALQYLPELSWQES